LAAFDFIVIGAGSAGCAVAGRLATQSSARVLLLEAGGSDRRLEVRAPLAFGRQFGTSLDWAYESEPEPGCNNRRIGQPRGRVLGGTSAMNGMVWVKGSSLDYDGWRLPGWGWGDVAPVFARIEQGPMRVTRVAYPDELSQRFVAAARAAGIAAEDDVSGPDLDGATIAPVTIHNGQRWTTARAYLRGQKNLTVVTKAEVRRVIIRNGRAVGVEYRRRGSQQRAFADHEVVVSAGAFGSPQLLQVSGVGPADHLRSVGITALVDSPGVGDGLTDHPSTFATWALTPGHVGLADATNPKWLLQWLIGRRGKLTSNIMEAVAHVRSTADLPACDFQIVFAPIDVLAGTTGVALKPTASVMQSYWTPKSRGSVMVRSADPATPPAIRMNLLTERDDVDALVRAIQCSRKFIATEPIASAIDREVSPGRDSDLEAHIRNTALTTAHPACSVAMGSESDSPLDEKLRVRGVENLRVADASALPQIPRANTNAPSIMIGERCADFLLAGR
jgi:choline dehydrogenase